MLTRPEIEVGQEYMREGGNAWVTVLAIHDTYVEIVYRSGLKASMPIKTLLRGRRRPS